MKDETNFSPEELEEIREKLQGTPLEPRTKWILKQIVFVLMCIAGLVAVIVLAHGIWLAVGLTVVAFFIGMLPELFIDLRYGKYLKEWKLANNVDL